MRNKRSLYLVTSLLILIVILATAFGSLSVTATGSPTTNSTNDSTDPAISPSPSAAAGTFTTNLSGEPATIDPNKVSWAEQITVAKQLFRGVLGFNADLTLKAVTATEIPTVANGGISSDGLTYTFKLRNDVTWSDGAKVTAKDYVYSIKRMLSPAVASEYASFYFDIVGAEAYNGSADKDAATQTQLRDAVGVSAPDDYTLQIKLAQQRPVFLQMMALWSVYPVREDIITKFGDQWTEAGNLIGNGPFILAEWVHADHITLKPNPDYWGPDKPQAGQIILRMVQDANAAMAAYRNNEMDLVQVPGGTEKATMADPTLSKELLRYSMLQTFAIQFNVTKAPFDNVKVRQAIATAIDRTAYVDAVRNGLGKAAYSWIPPGMPGYDPNLGTQYKVDAAKAKQLLAEAGYTDVSKLPPIKFTYANAGANPITAQFIQGQLKTNLGIQITLDPLESKAATEAINSGNYQMGWFGWGADYPDPDNWLPGVFMTGAGNNHTKYSSKEFDALCTQAMHELDSAKALQLWNQAQTILVNDAPAAFMFNTERLWVIKPWVKGIVTTGMDNQIPGDNFYTSISISK